MSAASLPKPYQSLDDVPLLWRSLENIPLSLEQVNEVVANAVGSAKGGLPDYGGARASFRLAHRVEGNVWVKIKDPVGELLCS